MTADPSPMRTPADLAELIADQGIAAELITGIGDTPTVAAAAQALGVGEEEILKTLIFFCQDTPYAVITHGRAVVPTRGLADHFGVGKRQIKLAKGWQAAALTGYPVGGVPPFGHIRPLPTLLDQTVFAFAVVYGGGGDDRTLLKITPAELLRVTRAHLLDLSGKDIDD